MGSEAFGQSRIGPVQKLVVGAEPGPVLEVLDLGATVHRLWVTGGDGVRRNVVLGHATADEYLDSGDYIGGTIGRYANRIRGGQFVLDGVPVQVATNEAGNQLHGGPDGFHRRVWEVVELADDRVVLALTSPAGDQGYPGTLTAQARFEVDGDAVRIALSATTDTPTVVGMTSHAYFNLDGDGSGPVGSQLLAVHAGSYLPTDGAALPGDPTPVADTRFDLTRPVLLSDAGEIDHNFVLDGTGWRVAATLDSPSTRTRLELRTDQPGLQVYTGIALDGSGRSTTGRPYLKAEGLALEPQLFPDTPNRPEFGSAVLRPGETYRSRIEWRFVAAH